MNHSLGTAIENTEGQVSRTRYRVGLFMLLPHVIYSSLTFYVPDFIPGYSAARIPMNLIADFLFVVTLLVLGGDFWDFEVLAFGGLIPEEGDVIRST